ncbi:hypothetical protein [Ornithinibacillus halophilus]|nr:hypothetical protein [Ornithinibacillus halophilus]
MNNLYLQSKQRKQNLMIFYMDQSNNITQRIIRVVDIKENAIVAFCYYRKQVRTFKINNILSVAPTGKKIGA